MDRDDLEHNLEKMILVGGFKAYVTLAESRVFDKIAIKNENYQKFIVLQRVIAVKEALMTSETDLDRRDRFAAELVDLLNQSDTVYHNLYDIAAEWYRTLLEKDIEDGDSQ